MEVVRIGKERYGEASEVLARAFFDDPAWVWPLLGAARWLPPGRPSMRVTATLRALVTAPLRLGVATAPFLAYGRSVEQMRADVARGPHWYLAGIGVEPSAQRRGVGAALLRPGVEAAAAGRVPAVLLTNNESNLGFYESHGFAVVREGHTPENGPRAWAM